MFRRCSSRRSAGPLPRTRSLLAASAPLTALLLTAHVANADAPAPPMPPAKPDAALVQGARALTLEEATKLAAARSPQVQTAQAMLQAARAYRTFGTMPRIGNPVLNLRAMVGRPDDPAATYSAMVGLPLDFSGRRNAWKREASFVEQEAEARLRVVENEARAEAREAFIDTALSRELVRVAHDNSEIAREFSTRVKARFDAKAATALDLSLAERDYAESVADVANAQASLAESLGRLRHALDFAPNQAVETAALSAPGLPAELTVERLLELAAKQRRDPAVYRAGAARFGAADQRLRREQIAPITVAGEYEAQGNNNTQTSGGVNVGTELPLFLRNQGERAVARGEAQAQQVQAELSVRRVGREAVIAYEQLAAALRELSALEQQATPAAERALAMTMEMLEVGAIDYFRLLNARQMAFALRARRVEALRTAWRRRIALERAVGGLQVGPEAGADAAAEPGTETSP